ncbi:MAG: DUF1566 domain-containing protein [Candidatus Electrothrix sp. AR5]|nr:DUF1566 domain-containing protein [Candidatus Electrothrix sp. AR5]
MAVKIFCSVLSKLAVTALFSFLSATVLFAANWNPLPDTGQTQCYDVSGNVITCPAKGEPLYGQDANYQSAAPSYKDNGNGTVTDNNTGLVWQQETGSQVTWQGAIINCNNLNLAGPFAWRLPSMAELESINDYSAANEYINPIFQFFSYSAYWSDEAHATDTTKAWDNYIWGDLAADKSTPRLTRCVAGARTSMGDFTDNGNTVTDQTTGLTWRQQFEDTNSDGVISTPATSFDHDAVTWQEALAWCEQLTADGKSDWRVPNIRELRSIIDRSKNEPSIYSELIDEVGPYFTWSSTTQKASKDKAWGVNSWYGESWAHAKTGEQFVRCVRGGLPNQNQNEITAENYSFGNVDPRSDRFSIWMDISVNGERPDKFCDDYTLSIEGDNEKKAHQIKCSYAQHIASSQANAQYCRVDFEIHHDEHSPTPAYFENGKITVRNNSTNEESILSGLAGFSVYGTTFDLSKDAWSFGNSSWIKATHDAEEYREIIANEIDTADERDTNVGRESTREDFNLQVGFDEYKIRFSGFYELHGSKGLCYGLASSAIANFTHKNSPAWGTGGVANWESEMNNHWDNTKDHARTPFNPFDKNIKELTWQETSKMIMYYFAAQSTFLNSHHTGNWVGKDQNSFKMRVNKDTERFIINSTLAKGRPALFSNDNHAVTLVQLLKWRDEIGEKTVYMLWDNNIVFDDKDKLCPYVEWHVRKYDPIPKYFYRIEKFNRKIEVMEKLTLQGDLPHILLPCYNNLRDSQNIYNLWNESCPEIAEEDIMDAAKEASLQEISEPAVNYNAPDHLKIMFIGGTIDGIYDQATGNKISPVFTDTLQPGQAAIQSTMGGTYHLIYLPADTTYRVEATKSSDMPYAEVYATIPNTDGTADKLYYDNIGLSKTDATGFYFLVGRGNSDRTLHRTGASDKAPDYDITLDMAITPPTEFSGIFNAGQVQLSWNNTDHPSLSLVKVIRNESGFPSSPTDGVEIYSGVGENTADNTAQTNTLYYYAAFSMDNQGRYSESATAAVDTARFAVTGEVTDNSTGVNNAKVEIRNSEQFPVAMTYTGTDGSYILGNLENGSYSVEVSATGYSIDNSPQTVTINNGNQVVDFTTTAVQSLNFVFDIDGLNLGSQAQISWKFRNIDSGGTVIIQKIANNVVTQLAEVPISDNYILWNVDGFVDEEITLKILLKNDSSVSDTDSLKILPKVSVEKNPWTMFLPAILAGAQQDTGSIPTVTSAGGQVWMDRNLGATRVATSRTDEEAYGDLYQWGRLADGHEKRTSGTTTETSSSDVPGHGKFIISDNSNVNWRIPENYNLWQGVNGVNNPCPAGFRLPTYDELESERQSWSSNDPTGAFASPLKLVLAGSRFYNGNFSGAGSSGIYWSSTSIEGGGAPRGLYMSSDNAVGLSSYYGSAFSVRCIKN